MNFIESLIATSNKNNSLLCVGLDPDIDRIPSGVSVFAFLKNIVDTTHDLVCSYKPQIAYFASYGGEKDLENIITYIQETYQIPVILDAKRGDIGSTATQYAREAFERYHADALTVNPYMGSDTLVPYLNYKDKGVMVICKTSNPGSGDFEDMVLQNGNTLYEEVALRARNNWNQDGQILLVVGATYPRELQKVRNIVGDDIFLLIPGIGAQGGDIESTVRASINSVGSGIIVNSARAILYPSSGTPREEALKTRDTINLYR